MLDKILNLKIFTQNSLPQWKVIISTVINRTDDDKPSLTVENLNNHLNSLKLDIVDKFDDLKLLVKNNLVVFMISETKLYETFPEGQFLVDGFNPPYRIDRNTNGGGIAFDIREDMPSRQISFKNGDKHIEHFFVGINLRKKMRLILCSYNPHLQFIDKHLTHIEKGLDSISSKYDD